MSNGEKRTRNDVWGPVLVTAIAGALAVFLVKKARAAHEASPLKLDDILSSCTRAAEKLDKRLAQNDRVQVAS